VDEQEELVGVVEGPLAVDFGACRFARLRVDPPAGGDRRSRVGCGVVAEIALQLAGNVEPASAENADCATRTDQKPSTR
jgi:hypothetical protein